MSNESPTSAVTAPTSAAPEPRARRLDRFDGRDLLLGLATVAAPLVALVPVLRLWEMSWRVPFQYGADATFYLMLVKDLVGGGWYFTNPSLGAPFGQQLYDFPQGADNLNLLVIKLLGLFTDDPVLAMNLFYLLTFPVVALSALLVLRRLGLSRPAAFFCAMLFTFLPYHFWRNETHLFLSAYVAVPIGAYLTLATLEGKLLFATRADASRGLSRRTLLTSAACVVVGSTGLYYAFFTILLVGVAAIVAGAARRSRAVAVSGLAAAAAVAIVVAINLSPSFVYTWRHGPNQAPLLRGAHESELFGLKLTQLLLPVDGHRLEPFARRSLLYEQTTVVPVNQQESGQTLGTTGDVGFVSLLFVALASCVAGARWRPPPILRHASFATVVAVLFGITTGFATLLAYAVTSKLHTPARISIFIAFFSLLAVGVLIDAAARRLLPHGRRGRWLAIGLAPMLALGIADQTTDGFVPSWDGVKSAWRTDAAFASAAQRALPERSMVFQLPYTPFPDNVAPVRMLDYDHARPYLHARDLRWSYGAMKGRPQDWAASLAALEPRVYVPAVAAAGFGAVYVDRYGYEDGGRSLERSLRALVGPALLVSSDARYALYGLQRYADALEERAGEQALAAAAATTLNPVRLDMSDGFSAPSTDAEGIGQWSAAPTVQIRLVNPGRSTRAVLFATEVTSREDTRARVDFIFPGGGTSRVNVSETPVSIRRALRVRPGTSEIVVATSDRAGAGAGDSTRYLQFVGTRIVDRALLRLAAR